MRGLKNEDRSVAVVIVVHD